MKFQNKIVVVTGAASGIGLDTVKLFASEGATVIMLDIHESGYEIEKNLHQSVKFYRVDVSNYQEVNQVFKEIILKYEKIDVIVNNAGIESTKSIFETDEEHWDQVININLKSVFICSKIASEIMRKNNSGVIINTASNRGLVGAKGSISYNASKGGVVIFTKSLALELAEYNIRVNCVCPGAIETPMLRRDINEKQDPSQELKKVIDLHPLRRLGQSKEVANAIIFLASEEASNITGVALPVDGGYTTQ